MGWYDAFRGDTARVNVSGVTNDTGSAAKNFGDAFKDIGKTMYDGEMDREKSAVLNLQKQNEQGKIDDRASKWVQDEDNKDYLSQAFNASTKADLETVYPLDETNSVDAATREKVNAHFQDKFNNEAINTSIAGEYKTFEEYNKDNSELVRNADGKTMSQISKYFSDKDAALAALKAQEKEVKHATEINKLTAKNGAGGFKYDENTDAKIAAQVKSALGMDTPDFTMSDKVKVEYQNAVAGSAKISKAYNLEPSLAIHVYRNPDLYELKDGTVYEKPQVKDDAVVEDKEPEWKKYMKK
jgi:hypothetical protein